MHVPIRLLGVLLLLGTTKGPVLAATCEDLLATIGARIRANGVANFSVTAVDLAASAPGKQVGTCDIGRKKIMYVRESSSLAIAASPAASANAASSRPGVITECADGRVIKEGTCKK